MARGISLRTDYNADDLRRLSRSSPDSKQTRRLLALALIYDGRPSGSVQNLSLFYFWLAA